MRASGSLNCSPRSAGHVPPFIYDATIPLFAVCSLLCWRSCSPRLTVLQQSSKVRELRQQVEENEEFLKQFTCPYCHAPVTEQHSVPLSDHDDGYLEAFACGYTAIDGYIQSPCPSAPDFPKLEEFELIETKMPGETIHQWECNAKPLTENAKRLRLWRQIGRTREEAHERLVSEYQRMAKPW
jgi:hypothetical protein